MDALSDALDVYYIAKRAAIAAWQAASEIDCPPEIMLQACEALDAAALQAYEDLQATYREASNGKA